MTPSFPCVSPQVPAVAMAGEFTFGRMAQSYYRTMGLEKICCIASDMARQANGTIIVQENVVLKYFFVHDPNCGYLHRVQAGSIPPNSRRNQQLDFFNHMFSSTPVSSLSRFGVFTVTSIIASLIVSSHEAEDNQGKYYRKHCYLW